MKFKSRSLRLKLRHEFIKPWEINSDIFAPVFLSESQRPLCSVLAKVLKNNTLCPCDLSLQRLGVSLHGGMQSVSSE